MHRTKFLALWLGVYSLLPAHAAAAEPDYTRAQDWLLLATGAAAGFLLHETGHLTLDLAIRDEPGLKPVALGPVPFFAIDAQRIKSPNQLYAVAMMGFLVEAEYTEAIFASHPELIRHHRPFLEGLLLFHFALDLGYAITAYARVGPRASDVNSMMRASGLPHWALGSMLLGPLVIDVLRYFKPELRHSLVWIGMGARMVMFSTVFVI